MSADAYAYQSQIYNRAGNVNTDAGELWRAYQSKRADPAARQALILRYAFLVKFVAGRLAIFLPPAISSEDLLSHGTIGLIESVDRFDPDLGVKFETFASRRIWGAMIDALRGLSELPRSTTRQVRALESAIADLQCEFGRSPSTAEIAKHLQMSEAAVSNLLVAASFSMVSLDATSGSSGDDEGPSLLDLLVSEGDDPADDVEREEQMAMLSREIDRLPDRERLVLVLYYHEELTLKEIGKVLGVTESRVSQLHSMAISRLRAGIAPRRSAFR
jgi:RNA polymerase sigma factor FliA